MFNDNINDIKGKEIGLILQENLDVATTLTGLSLDALEIKILISKLKSINKPLDDTELKKIIIENIKKWNNEFTALELSPTPEFRASEIIIYLYITLCSIIFATSPKKCWSLLVCIRKARNEQNEERV